MIIIAGVVHRRYKKFLTRQLEPPVTTPQESFIEVLRTNLPFVALFTAELFLALFYLIQNGFIAFIIAPVRVWGLLLTAFLFYQAQWRITDQEFKQAALVCSPRDKLSTS